MRTVSKMPQVGRIGHAAMINDQARVSLVAQGTAALACEVCTANANVPNATVVVQHLRGGTVQLAACGWCVRALRRVAAATGGHAVFALAEGAIPVPASRHTAPRGARPAGPPVVLLEFVEHLRDPVDGTTYVARVCGRPRTGGTWEGWLGCVAVRLRSDSRAPRVFPADPPGRRSSPEPSPHSWRAGRARLAGVTIRRLPAYPASPPCPLSSAARGCGGVARCEHTRRSARVGRAPGRRTVVRAAPCRPRRSPHQRSDRA